MELVLGALILGVSALAVLELMRSGTANLEITEAESAARALASDLMERLSEPPSFGTPVFGDTAERFLGVPLGWREFMQHDPSLRYGFPPGDLPKLLDLFDVRLRVTRERPFIHPTLGRRSGMEAYTVSAEWTEGEHRREVTYACLVEL